MTLCEAVCCCCNDTWSDWHTSTQPAAITTSTTTARLLGILHAPSIVVLKHTIPPWKRPWKTQEISKSPKPAPILKETRNLKPPLSLSLPSFLLVFALRHKTENHTFACFCHLLAFDLEARVASRLCTSIPQKNGGFLSIVSQVESKSTQKGVSKTGWFEGEGKARQIEMTQLRIQKILVVDRFSQIFFLKDLPFYA